MAKLKEFPLPCARQSFQATGVACVNCIHLNLQLLLENISAFESSVDIKKLFSKNQIILARTFEIKSFRNKLEINLYL